MKRASHRGRTCRRAGADGLGESGGGVSLLGSWRHCLSQAEEPAGAEQHSPTEAFLRGGAPTAAGGLFSDGPWSGTGVYDAHLSIITGLLLAGREVLSCKYRLLGQVSRLCDLFISDSHTDPYSTCVPV